MLFNLGFLLQLTTQIIGGELLVRVFLGVSMFFSILLLMIMEHTDLASINFRSLILTYWGGIIFFWLSRYLIIVTDFQTQTFATIFMYLNTPPILVFDLYLSLIIAIINLFLFQKYLSGWSRDDFVNELYPCDT